MEAMAITLSKEERENGIRVNIIRPGLVETDMGARLVKAMGVKDIKDMNASSPFGRVGLPSDIGNTLAFLVSKEGEYITGATISVSAGT
jgi:NAD(P)-dependent dehydrogenase (short-subunit alcohol dehydrogenase family)